MKSRQATAALFFVAAMTACSSRVDDDGSTSTSDSISAGAPRAIHPGWFKTPESIAETMTRTWELDFTQEEELKYFGGLRASLGGVNVAAHGSLIEKPNELFVLATHTLSVLAAEKLIAKQQSKSAANEPYLFDGLGFAEPDTGCYDDDTKTWCDSADEIQLGDLTKQAVNPSAGLSKSLRKRLMHKMQSIGEFFLLAIDERTLMPAAANGGNGSNTNGANANAANGANAANTNAANGANTNAANGANTNAANGANTNATGANGASASDRNASLQHAPAFLLDEVFLPKLAEGAMSVEQEKLAWREVVTTILMSGWFFDLPADGVRDE